jgi:hypothetical protein
MVRGWIAMIFSPYIQLNVMREAEIQSGDTI